MDRRDARLPDMWDRDPVVVELKRPVWAFAAISVLCAVLMIVSAGRVDAVLGVFDAPRPISAPAPTSAPAPAVVLPDTSSVASIPEELTAAPVGRGAGSGALTQPTPAATPAKPLSAAKTDRKVDRAAAKTDRTLAKAERKTDRAAAKADRTVAKAERKADRAAAKADRKAAKKA